MKRFFSKIFIFLGVLSLVLGTLNNFGGSISYAEDLELIGTDLGLEIIPSDTKLFDLKRLNPGDTEEAMVTIRNNYSEPFQLYMDAERVSSIPLEGEPDLFEQLDINVFLRGDLIYSGKMINFATTGIYLGEFESGDIENLRAIIHLPGPETGNEFQGTFLEVRWIFTATSQDPVEPPVGPEPPGEPELPVEPPVEPEPLVAQEVPEEPEEPEEDIIIEEEVPEGVPQIEDEEDEEEEVIIEEEIPEGVPILPKTGEISTILYYGAGIAFLALGTGFRFKKKD